MKSSSQSAAPASANLPARSMPPGLKQRAPIPSQREQRQDREAAVVEKLAGDQPFEDLRGAEGIGLPRLVGGRGVDQSAIEPEGEELEGGERECDGADPEYALEALDARHGAQASNASRQMEIAPM